MTFAPNYHCPVPVPTIPGEPQKPPPGVTLPENEQLLPPPDPFLDGFYPAELGIRLGDRLDRLKIEFGCNAISRRDLTGRIFSFVEGTAMGLVISEKEYGAHDPYVLQAPVRRTVLENMDAQNPSGNVTYHESSGLMELGGGFMLKFGLSVPPFSGVGWGVSGLASALFRYRTSQPVFQAPSDDAQKSKPSFPFDAEKALNLVPGAEFEMTGQGRVFSSVAFSARAGWDVIPGAAGAGLGLTAGVSGAVRGECNLNILALEKPGTVRVTIRSLDEETSAFLFRLRAGLNFGGGTITGTVVGGMLIDYAQKLNASNFEELVNLYTTLNASVYGSTTRRGLCVGSWDLDLNKPEAREAYESLIRLNTIPAEKLVASGSKAVSDTHAQECEIEMRLGADVGLFGEKLLIQERLETQRKGRLVESTGDKMVYRESLYSRRKRNILTGTKEINWEAVTIQRGEDNKDSYLHLRFEQKDWDFGTNGINRILRFAEAVKIPQSEFVGPDPERFARAALRLTQRAEVDITTDVYITEKGLANIYETDAKTAAAAYLRMSSKIRKKYRDFDFTAENAQTKEALRLIQVYRSYTGIKNVLKVMARLHVVPGLREDYNALTGRNLETDAKLIQEAEHFGAAVESLTNVTSHQDVSQFFLSLGRIKGFNYMQTIATLADLAGAKETRLNDLCVSSGGISIRNASQGVIANPRDVIAAQLYRLAQV